MHSEEEAVEAMINEGGPAEWNGEPTVDEMIHALQSQIAELSLRLTASQIAHAKALARIEELTNQE